MKQNKHIIILSAMLIFLSSCGSLSVSKKRYSRGFNIDWFSSKDDVAKSPAKKDKKKVESVKLDTDETVAANENGVVSEENIESQEIETSVVLNSDVPVAEREVETKVSKKRTSNGIIKKSKSISPIKNKILSKVNHKSKVDSISETNDSDVGLLILVILAIFIAPLAVYLYFGELNGHFWLSLILYLLGVGFILSFNLGIGAAIIHALLVVFGIFG